MDKITWLGQAGLLFEHRGFKVMVDPYLSDSVKKIEPHNFRRVPVDESFFEVKPDLMIFTHNHLDHYDPETVEKFISPETSVTVLAPTSVWNVVTQIGGLGNNYILFNRRTTWTAGGLRFTAVRAEHSDPAAIGVVIDDGESKYYVTGDTLYNEDVFADLPDDIYAVFLPVNGLGCNMNMTDAAAFAARTGAERVVPLHIGLFDSFSADDLHCGNKVIPEFYKEIKI